MHDRSTSIGKQGEDTEAFFQSYLDNKFDCIISPGFAVPALKHGDSKVLAFGALYTFIFNILDMPSCNIPIDLVKKGEDEYKDHIHGNDIVNMFAARTTKGSEGVPIGIQVSCLPYEDEKLCGISRQFEQAMAFPYLPIDKVNKYKPAS